MGDEKRILQLRAIRKNVCELSAALEGLGVYGANVYKILQQIDVELLNTKLGRRSAYPETEDQSGQ